MGLQRGESIWLMKRQCVVTHTVNQTEINPALLDGLSNHYVHKILLVHMKVK